MKSASLRSAMRTITGCAWCAIVPILFPLTVFESKSQDHDQRLPVLKNPPVPRVKELVWNHGAEPRVAARVGKTRSPSDRACLLLHLHEHAVIVARSEHAAVCRRSLQSDPVPTGCQDVRKSSEHLPSGMSA